MKNVRFCLSNIRKEKYHPATTTPAAATPVSRSGYTRISVGPSVCHAQGTPLDSETGWTGVLWSNCVLLILEN